MQALEGKIDMIHEYPDVAHGVTISPRGGGDGEAHELACEICDAEDVVCIVEDEDVFGGVTFVGSMLGVGGSNLALNVVGGEEGAVGEEGVEGASLDVLLQAGGVGTVEAGGGVAVKLGDYAGGNDFAEGGERGSGRREDGGFVGGICAARMVGEGVRWWLCRVEASEGLWDCGTHRWREKMAFLLSLVTSRLALTRRSRLSLAVSSSAAKTLNCALKGPSEEGVRTMLESWKMRSLGRNLEVGGAGREGRNR